MAKRQFIEYFTYTCSITEKAYKVTKKVKNPDDLMSIEAYYELNPEQDDRPEKHQKKKS